MANFTEKQLKDYLKVLDTRYPVKVSGNSITVGGDTRELNSLSEVASAVSEMGRNAQAKAFSQTIGVDNEQDGATSTVKDSTRSDKRDEDNEGLKSAASVTQENNGYNEINDTTEEPTKVTDAPGGTDNTVEEELSGSGVEGDPTIRPLQGESKEETKERTSKRDRKASKRR